MSKPVFAAAIAVAAAVAATILVIQSGGGAPPIDESAALVAATTQARLAAAQAAPPQEPTSVAQASEAGLAAEGETPVVVTGIQASSQPAEPLPPADAVLFENLEQLDGLLARGPVILYFHATWCPTCQATMISFQARWPDVRPGLTLVIADYDTEPDLKARYGVTYQNTFVQVGQGLARLQIWNGGGVDVLNERTFYPPYPN